MTTVKSLYQQIYETVRRIPYGKVATYGQIAKIICRCSPRNVGYAMAAVRTESGIPWFRVINSKGEISRRRSGSGHSDQRYILESEGVCFNRNGTIDLEKYLWANEPR